MKEIFVRFSDFCLVIHIHKKMAAAAVQPSNISDYLSKKQQESPKELGSEWAELEELHNKK